MASSDQSSSISTRRAIVVTDNLFALALARELNDVFDSTTDVAQSPRGTLEGVPFIDVKERAQWLVDRYDLVVSMHCRQIFPESLFTRVRCINVHPGLNPFNRGWYPQVFSIINGLPAGVTIHEIDSKLDHGPIICQREYKISPWDTSLSAYQALMRIERELVIEFFPAILAGTYSAMPMESEGNLNYRSDFGNLCKLDLASTATLAELIDRLRALTHGEFKNAYFVTDEGRRVYVSIALEPGP